MDSTTPAASSLNSSIPPEQPPVLFDEIGKLVNQAGGVSGLAQQFEQKGLGGLMSSWIGNGANAPMMGEEVLQVLGKDRILEIAAKAGLSEAQVTSGISQILPQVIDGLTPHGTMPDHAPNELQNALGMLKSRFLGA